jgi:hypothetical protein
MRATRRKDPACRRPAVLPHQIRQEQKATVGLAKGGGGGHKRKRVIEKHTLKAVR